MNDDFLQDERLRAFVEDSEIEIPMEKVQEEIRMLQIEAKHGAQYGVMCGMSDTRTAREELEAQTQAIPELAVRMVKTEMVLNRLIFEEKLMPSREALETEAVRIAEEKGISSEMAEKFFGKDYTLLVRDLQMRMAVELVHRRVKNT